MTSSISPDARQLWRSVRAPAVIMLLIIAAGIVTVLVRGTGDGGALDPGSVDPEGSRALARLLVAQGVRVDVVRSAAAAEEAADGSTVLVTKPGWLPPRRLSALSERAGELVLIAPDQEAVDVVAPGTRVTGGIEIADREPACTLDIAAGVATIGGIRYQSRGTACYDSTLVQSTTVTLLGTGAPLTNEHLDEDANAALSMRLLGQHERLVWFIPSLDDRPEERSFTDLVPDGVKFGLLQLGIAVVLLALWRARRLGPVVPEPLPVVARAAETVEGRARLYRRAGAADHAAEALRQATQERLIRRLGLPRGASAPEVVATVARHTGRPETEIHALLYGPPSVNETELAQLADALDALENKV